MKPPDQEPSAPTPDPIPPSPPSDTENQWDPTAAPLPPPAGTEAPGAPPAAEPGSDPEPPLPPEPEPEPGPEPPASRTSEPEPGPEPGPSLPAEPEPEPEPPVTPAADAEAVEDIGPESSGPGGAEPDFDDKDDEAPLQRRRGGKRVVAFVLAALLVVGAASSLQFFFQGDEQAQSGAWRWSRLPFPPIDPRYGHAAVWTGSKMIVWGGFSGVAAEAGLPGAGIRADGAELDARTGNWEIVPPAPVVHRPDIPAAWTGTEMIAWGGDPAQPASGAAYNPDTNSWRPLPPSPLPARGGQSSVWTGTELILWGGRVAVADRPAELPGLSSGGAAYNPATDSWRELPPAPVPPRDGHLTVWTGTEMIVWGGAGEATPGASARLLDGAAFDPASNGWRAIAAAPSSPEGNASWSGTEMLVWGSRAERVTPAATAAPTPGAPPVRPAVRFAVEALAYNPATNQWRRLPAPPFPARTNAVAVWSGSRLIVWGGLVRGTRPGSARPAAGGAAYHPRANRWETIPEAPILGRDIGFSMVRAGDGVIVWGGKATDRGTAGRTLADGAVLTPREG